MHTETPIACALAPGEYDERLRWIAELNGAALRAHSRDDLRLALTYAPEAADRVRELVDRERRCCDFLHFGVTATSDEVHLTIVAPEAVRKAADDLFAPFLSGVGGAAARTGCGDARCGCGTAAPTSLHRRTASPVPAPPAGRIPAAAATTAAAAALACGVCCVVPIAFPALALTSLGGVVAMFADSYRWAVDLALVLSVAGWGWVAWQSFRLRRRPAAATLRAMTAATLLGGAALAWPLVEPIVRRALQ